MNIRAMRLPTSALALLLAILSGAALADEPAKPASVIQEVEPGVYKVGALRLEEKKRLLTFPGSVNMDKGQLEYLLVTPEGPTHESLLVTDVQANDVHLAMLLLGVKGPEPVPAGGAAPAQITAEYLKTARKPTGEQVMISVRWKDATGKEKSAAVEDWVQQATPRKAASRGPWLYTGSGFGSNGSFLAQQEGLIAALIINPSALINNPRPGNDSDRMWEVNEKSVPPAQTPLEIELRLVNRPAEKAP